MWRTVALHPPSRRATGTRLCGAQQHSIKGRYALQSEGKCGAVWVEPLAKQQLLTCARCGIAARAGARGLGCVDSS